MAVITSTTIANSALAKLGADRIINLSDDTREARILREQYEKNRNELLRSHPWNFAIKRVALAALATAPAYGYSLQFQLPTDCLRVLEIDTIGMEWEREGNVIVTDSAVVYIRYLYEVTEAGYFDSCFAEVLATKLAADVCFAITQSTTLKDMLTKEYQQKLREARSFDGQEGGPKRVYAREWLDSRN
jgi:hypothetical protein